MTLSEAARSYLGVPFLHQGRNRSGLDCVGLRWIAGRDVGEDLPDYREYRAQPNRGSLLAHVVARLGEPALSAPICLTDLRPDDTVLMRFYREPHHVAIVGELEYHEGKQLTLIHACGTEERVIEYRLTPDKAATFTHVFRSAA
jgi:hypothetical protein